MGQIEPSVKFRGPGVEGVDNRLKVEEVENPRKL